MEQSNYCSAPLKSRDFQVQRTIFPDIRIVVNCSFHIKFEVSEGRED